MIHLIILLWSCGTVAAISLRAVHRQSITIVDLVVSIFFSWIAALLEVCHVSASFEVWSGDKPPPRRRHLMGGNPYQKFGGKGR